MGPALVGLGHGTARHHRQRAARLTRAALHGRYVLAHIAPRALVDDLRGTNLCSFAVAAAFAAPTMALLIGLGITCIVEGVKHYPARHLVMLDNALLVGFALLFLSGLVSLVWVPLAARIPAKTFAAAQLLLYVLFVIGTVLVEFRYVLPNPIFALQ